MSKRKSCLLFLIVGLVLALHGIAFASIQKDAGAALETIVNEKKEEK